jgi:hypothetical protein
MRRIILGGIPLGKRVFTDFGGEIVCTPRLRYRRLTVTCRLFVVQGRAGFPSVT